MVHGRVRGANGTAVLGATVTLVAPDGSQIGRATVNDTLGYALPAPGVGAYILVSAAERHRPEASSVVVGNEPLQHDVVLYRSGSLTVQVHSAVDEEAIAQAAVVVTGPAGEVLASAHTAADGSCSFDAPQPDTVTVVASAPHHHPVAQSIEAASGAAYCRLDLPAAAALRGTVVIDGTDQPIQGARVSLIDATGCIIAETTTGQTGEYTLTDLNEGDYTLIATGYPPVALGVKIASAEEAPFIVRLGYHTSPGYSAKLGELTPRQGNV